ncbi:MAG: hypothetical protein IPH36_22660 [Saprospiraceae bacterium]|nr:hypothetical protein [Saprospiraceae bacterium]
MATIRSSAQKLATMPIGSNNVFIGYNAGYNEINGSNKLYIENSDADSTQA